MSDPLAAKLGDTLRDKTEQAIEQYIRPLVEADGGQIALEEVTETSVRIRLWGTCAGCPGRLLTVERVIQPTLRKILKRDVIVDARDGDGRIIAQGLGGGRRRS